MPIRLLVADVDGALVTRDKVLTPAARRRRDLRAAGIAFAVTSGRPPRGMSMLIEPLELNEPIAGFNGGVFVNPDLSVIEGHMLDPAAAEDALSLILDHGLDAWVYTEDEWLIRDKDAPHVAREAWTVKFAARWCRTSPPKPGARRQDRWHIGRCRPRRRLREAPPARPSAHGRAPRVRSLITST